MCKPSPSKIRKKALNRHRKQLHRLIRTLYRDLLRYGTVTSSGVAIVYHTGTKKYRRYTPYQHLLATRYFTSIGAQTKIYTKRYTWGKTRIKGNLIRILFTEK